jgi:hypothetical protein
LRSLVLDLDLDLDLELELKQQLATELVSSVMVELGYTQAVDIKLVACQVSPRYSLLSKTTLRNISGFLINKQQ